MEVPVQYLNVNMIRGVDSLNGKPAQATYNKIFSSPIVDDASKYFMAVQRMSVSTSLIPIFVCPVVVGQPDINLTPYQIYAFDANVEVPRQGIIFYTQDSNAARPQPPIDGQDTSTGYYNVYTVQYFLNQINSALLQIAANLYTAGAPVPNPSDSPYNAPYIRYDPITTLFEIVAPLEYDIYGNSYANVKIYFNEALQALLGLKTLGIGLDAARPNVFQILIGGNSHGGNIELIIDDNDETITRVVVQADHRAIDKWSPLSKLVITTSSLPVFSQFTQPSVTYGASTFVSNTNSIRPLGQKILTDFEPDHYNTPITDRNWLQYNTTGINNMRLLSLSSSYGQNISQFDIQIWWQDYYGNLYPLLLGVGDSVSISFIFIPKRLIG